MPKGRTLQYTLKTVFSRIGRRLSAAHRGALWHLPAFLLAACTPQQGPDTPVPGMRKAQIYILPSGKTTVQGLDLLFFQGEPLRRLDAWQHFDTVNGNRVTGTSSTAAETLVALAGCPAGTWDGIRTYASLQDIRFRLEDEDPVSPMMYGTGTAGSSGTLTLRSMLAKVTVRSIACEFSSRPYAGERLQNVRAYLTYASRECRPFEEDDAPVSWINAGRLDEVETASLPHPELVVRDLTTSLGGRIYPAADFFCYPNPSDGQEFGRPVTRLVIEGTLRGVTYYFPIDLPGLEADVQYRMDITLTRTGTTDPDTPAVSGSIRLDGAVMDWDGRELDDIHFR